jgi:light-regulated signal transduction histidine kinase (bacteriophytochrome)
VLGDEGKEFIGFAVDGATRMQALINDLLTYSRVGKQDGPLQRTECNRVLEHVLINLSQSIEESGAEVTVRDLPVVMGDASQLTRLFQNLVGNAIKFRGERRPEIEVDAVRDGEAFRFSVRDNGIGIDPRHADRVFQIFQRLHSREEYAGTGIGLAVCKRIVERHGGTIGLESTPGAGTTLLFTLRAARKEGP